MFLRRCFSVFLLHELAGGKGANASTHDVLIGSPGVSNHFKLCFSKLKQWQQRPWLQYHSEAFDPSDLCR